MKKILSVLLVMLFVITNLTLGQNNPCAGLSRFNYSISNRTVSFESYDSAGVQLSHYWRFGDGTTANAANPVHTYQANGTYRAWHFVQWQGANCVDSSFKDIVIQAGTFCDSLYPQFDWRRDSLNPNKIIFINQTWPSAATLQFLWSFGDGSSSTEKNPTHVYTTGGQYIVCVKATVPGTNCVKTYCDTIITTPPPCNLQPNFTWMRDSLQPLLIKFFNQSLPNPPPAGLQYLWSFGDGTSSTVQNPTHTYANAGQYIVCLKLSLPGTNCVKTYCDTINVTPSSCNLQPRFTWMRDSLQSLLIKFFNQSLPNPPPAGLQYLWSFGDGSSSTAQNPTHTYANAGQYVVCLKLSLPGTNCVKTYCDTVNTVPPLCNFQPNFTWTSDSLQPLRVKFINQTIIPVNSPQVRWTFGDGTSSTEWSPTHIYAQPGTYTVCLKIMLSNTCVKEVCKQVIVRACNIEPNFNWSIDTIYPLRGVQFHNLTPTTNNLPRPAVRWTFGDGSSSTEWNPFHQYAQPGTYTVCLKVEFFPGCVKQVCKTVVILAPVNCERLSDFKYAPSAEPNTFKFEANVINSSLKYVWTFGDGTGAFTPVTAHKYIRPGRYTVCLTVYRGENCASTTCKEINVGPLNCQQTIVKFEYQRLNPQGNIIKFTAVGNQPIISQRWTITKDSIGTPVIINASNPAYTFTQTGLYKVCLRAITANGCVKEYCEYVNINAVSQQCTLQVTPNPATTQVSFRIELPQPAPVIASIIDAQGIRRAIFYLTGTQGINNFTLPVSNLPVGYYTLEVKIGDRVCQGRFQKVN